MKNEYPNQLGELNALIYEIGENYGARKFHFRDERKAEALPPEAFQYVSIDKSNSGNNYGLRLYCLRLTESVVILFNGDLKTAQKVADCKNCKSHFILANKIASQIDEAIRNKFLKVFFKEIQGIEDFELEL